MSNQNSTVDPRDHRGRMEMDTPVAISLPGVGIICYMELRALPETVYLNIADKAVDLEREIERKAYVLSRIKDLLNH